METVIDEIADRIYRIATLVPGVGPSGMTFNQFLVAGDEPLLFHTGHRSLFAGVTAAIRKVLPPESIRHIGYSHTEADECGALEDFLALAPAAIPLHTRIGCATWLSDLPALGPKATRAPRPMKDEETLDLGGKTVRLLATPHLPHGWDAALLYEETTQTLFCSDLFVRLGPCEAASSADPLDEALATERTFRSIPITHENARALDRLADRAPARLATMHGPAVARPGAPALRGLAAYLREELARTP